ncbi:hypothetical protein OR1_01192 [Geobacter sp. OR-1]|uniref:FkbM family methyltransferase n=1 Tax=Geobacter sp. OR-1 TaxID=1266765 RepID=UPI000542A5BD|nr:FkbM family methyltransferase [Geobacter sp. OR-1]GAM08918.1 hypothetical protein OR1_01192 [Geobacter sp. OR-1]
MIKLSAITPKDLGGGINLIDLGASGEVPNYWKPLAHLTNLIGFDPNEEECSKLENKDSGFLSQKFLPYAMAGENRDFTLYKTNSIYCWSLLQPNLPWLRRFDYSDLFEVKGTEVISAVKLEDVEELKNFNGIDAIKLDTQGLELPILKASEKIIRECIIIETETGFTENYIGETTFDQIANYMRSMGFGLFDINPNHRVSRKNSLSGTTSNEEMLWCEAVWLRDYCRTELYELTEITREKALKALCIYANHGCYSFGVEAARRFTELGVLSTEEYTELTSSELPWILHRNNDTGTAIKSGMLTSMINLIPRRYFSTIFAHLKDLQDTQHPLSFLARKMG